jgi:hypothetical protein
MLSRILARLQLYGGSFSLDIPFYRTHGAEIFDNFFPPPRSYVENRPVIFNS